MTIQTMTVVLVEDNEALNFAITLLLRKSGYWVHSFQDADDLIENISKEEVDLFILDINLPNQDGFELMHELRPSFPSTDFMFISSYIDIKHIEKAFALGCEDYLKKPFEVEELLLRVKKIEARRYISGRIIIDEDALYRYDLDTMTLYCMDAPVPLTKIERSLLYLLLQHSGNVVSFDDLRENIWQKDVSNNAIAAVVHRLRKKLKKDFIESSRELGYSINKRGRT